MGNSERARGLFLSVNIDQSEAIEAEVRLAACDAGQMKVIPADVVFRELDNR